MNIKRIAIGTLVGGVALYVVGYVFWEVAFVGFFEENTGSATGVARETPILWAVALGTLFYAKLLTLAIDGKSGTASAIDGMKIGAIVGMLAWGTTDLILFGFQNVSNLTGTIADIVLEGVRGGACGAIIAMTIAKVSD